MTNGTSNPPPSTSVPPMATPAGPVTAVTTGTLIMDTYEIEKLINSGGMGEVYRGRNIHNGEPVAIKIVLPALAHDPKIVALFQKESTVLSRLSHEAIVRYHTFTIDRAIGRPCMVMEFVSGQPLGDRVEQGPMPLDEVKIMFRRVASGLDKAHRAGVVHRDLSPDNVILEEGSVDHAKLIDFGIAKSASIGGGTLLGGQFAGKFNWVSPEQLGAFGGVVDGRSDIYSLALLVAAASRGEVVQMGASIVDAVGKRSGVPDLTGVDPSLVPLLSYMLQPDPQKRPDSMSAVIAALDNPALVPSSVVSGAPQPLDPNRTIIGGTLPVAPVSQAPSPDLSLPPVSLPPVAMHPLQAPTAPPAAADWSMPTARPTTSGMATVISSQPPVTQTPAARGPEAEPEDVSPFGAPATAPIAKPAPKAVVQAPEPAKGKGGMIAVLGLLVVVGGAAGAYFSGIIGPAPDVPPQEEQADANTTGGTGTTQQQLDQIAADEAAAAEAAKAEQAAADQAAADAAAAEQAAAEQAAAEKAAADKAAADQAAADAAAKAEADAAAAKAAEEAAANQTNEEQAAAAAKAAADEAARQEAEAAAAAAKQAEEEAARVQAEADAAAKKAAEEAAALNADPAIAHTAWLAAATFDACVRLQDAPGESLLMDGFATGSAPLENLAARYKADLGRDADVAPHLINDQQCPVLDFVNRRAVAEVPMLVVQRDEAGDVVKSGGKISGTIQGINGRPFSAYLFSDAGGATNLKPYITLAPDGTAAFSFTLSMAAGAPPAPQVLLVMATEAPLVKLDPVRNGTSAKTLMPYIEVALKDNLGPTSLGLGFFRLEN